MNIVEAFAKVYKDTLSYSCNHKNGNRSSKRTDILNEAAATLIKGHLPTPDAWDYEFEQKIPCTRARSSNPTKGFSIDVIFTHRGTGRKIYILLKSIEASYNKNSANFTNTMIGEVQRIYGTGEVHGANLKNERRNDITLFLTLMANRLPRSNKCEEVKYMPLSVEDLRIFNKNVHQVCVMFQHKGKAPSSKKGLLGGINGELMDGEKTLRDYKEFLKSAA